MLNRKEKFLTILGVMKWALGEKQYISSMLKSKRYEPICVNFDDRLLTIKDNLTERIVEVRLINIGEAEWRLCCKNCRSSNCVHTLITIYSPEIAVLRDLYFDVENQILQIPHRIISMINPAFIMRNVIPIIALLILSMGLSPIDYDPSMETFRLMISDIYGLSGLVNTQVQI